MKAAYRNVPYYVNEYPSGFDRFIVDENKKLFAVFDGMGTGSSVKWAVDKIVEMVGIKSRGNETWESLQVLLNQAVESISKRAGAGTTATIVSVDTNGLLDYAHIGDSRLYVLHNNRVKQITSDEGVGNLLLNYVGFGGKGVCQAGIVYNWDKFMLCTDGITGDWEPQFMDDKTIEYILTDARIIQPITRCEALIAASKKQDDKTIIVVER